MVDSVPLKSLGKACEWEPKLVPPARHPDEVEPVTSTTANMAQ